MKSEEPVLITRLDKSGKNINKDTLDSSKNETDMVQHFN